MITMLWVGAALAGDPSVLQGAIDAEIQRGMSELKLPDQDGPFEIEISVVDGEYATSWSSFGHTVSHTQAPYRSARVEVRVGDMQVNSTNFMGMYGVPDGVEQRALPIDSVDVALRREIWLAMDAAYKGASQQLAGKLAARDGQQREYTPDSTAVPTLLQSSIESREIDGQWVEELTAAISAPLAAHPSLELADAVGRDWQGRRLLTNSYGTKAWIRTGHALFRVEAEARAPSGAIIRNTRSWVAQTPDQLPSKAEMVAQVTEMADWIVRSQTADVEEDYLGPVLFEGQAATEVFRQLLQPQVCGTPPREDAPDADGSDGISPPTARIGRRLLPDGWRVIDDPQTDTSLAGSYTHDMEGAKGTKVVLVDDGVVKNLLMSRTPRKSLSGTTGHARSLGSSRRAAMPSVVTITPRRTLSDKALRRKAIALARQTGLPYVMVVRRIITPAMDDGFQIAFSGDAPLPGLTTPLELFRLYPDGREEPVRNVSFSGVDRRVLRDIVAASRGAGPINVMDSPSGTGRFSIGPTGGLPATWDAPSILISEIELTGQPGGEQRIIPQPAP